MTVYNAVFRIDQVQIRDELSVGSAGVSRRDLWLNKAVYLTPAAPPEGATFLWEFLDKPVGSTASFLDASTGVASATSQLVRFVPDVWGTYRIRCTINKGEFFSISLAAVLLSETGGSTHRGWRIPAYKEIDTEANFPGQARGCAGDLEFILTDLENNIGGGTTLSVVSFLSSPSLVEVGTAVVAPAFMATYSTPPDSVLFYEGEVGVAWTPTNAPHVSSNTFTCTICSSVGFGLLAQKGEATQAASCSIVWTRKAYWFVGEAPVGDAPYDQTWIEDTCGCAGVLVTDKNGVMPPLTAGPGQRVYYAYRDAYGTSDFWVNNIKGGFDKREGLIYMLTGTEEVEAYVLYESTNANLGLMQVTVTAGPVGGGAM